MKLLALLLAVALPSTTLAQWGQPYQFQPLVRTPLVQPLYQAPVVQYPPPIRSYWYYNQVGPGYSFGVGTMPPQPVIVAPQPLFVPQQQYFQPFNWGW